MEMKGQLYTLESAIAVLILLSFLIFFYKAPSLPEFKTINYKLKAYNALSTLDESGELRKNVMEKNVSSIEEKLSPYISINYTVVIFNETSNITVKPSFVDKENILSLSYLLAGDVNEYKPREVKVYLWGFS